MSAARLVLRIAFATVTLLALVVVALIALPLLEPFSSTGR